MASPTQCAQQLADVRRAQRGRLVARLRNAVQGQMSALPDLDARVYLFGSWASGCFDAMSDIDLLVLAPDHCAVDAAQRALMAVADDVVGLTDDAWQERLRAADPFVAALASERVLLYGTPEASRDAR